MAAVLAQFVPDPGAAIVVAILALCGLWAFFKSTRPAPVKIDPIEAEYASKPPVDPEDVARRVVL